MGLHHPTAKHCNLFMFWSLHSSRRCLDFACNQSVVIDEVNGNFKLSSCLNLFGKG
jgi:hypothetical protein